MPLLIPLGNQSPVPAEIFTYYFASVISADALAQIVNAGMVALDVTEPTESAALLGADVEGTDGGALAIIDLVESELR